MNKILTMSLSVGFTLLVVVTLGAAFSEPTTSPPGGDVAAPINSGPISQIKEGDLEVKNFTVVESITLGGEKRSSWPVFGGANITSFTIKGVVDKSLGNHDLCFLQSFMETHAEDRDWCVVTSDNANNWRIQSRYADCIVDCIDFGP